MAVNLHTKAPQMRCWLICLFVNLFVFISARGQAQLTKNIASFKRPAYLLKKDQPLKEAVSNIHIKQTDLPGNATLKPLPADYYSKHIGFFCIKELQLEKTTKIPLRLRLGSLNYCNMLEGKNR